MVLKRISIKLFSVARNCRVFELQRAEDKRLKGNEIPGFIRKTILKSLCV